MTTSIDNKKGRPQAASIAVLLSSFFIRDSTTANTTIDPIFRWNTTMQYQYGWWIYPPQNGNAAHFYGWGNHGQFIYVVPEKSLIIVRHGYAYADVNWVYLFESIAAAISQLTACMKD